MNLFIPGDLVKVDGRIGIYVIRMISQRGYTVQGYYGSVILFAYDWQVSPA